MSRPTDFSPEGLADAVKALFEHNHYTVTGPLQIHGAEVDLMAVPADPFAPPVYIEATIEYVDTAKFGKDATKFLTLREVQPNATLICISSKGFTKEVKERAKAARVEILTYEELFGRFQRFGPYVSKVTGEGELATRLTHLNNIYQEPLFEDQFGRVFATEFLTEWRRAVAPQHPWIVVTGDYGTGKTALTEILLLRWMQDYNQNPSLSLPLRIELRDFSRQFDARGLLHHFLDHNGLGSLPIDFVLSLLRQKRIVLLLDGYDEMAQYLNARERRACLQALAELAKDGARGLLTSRPSYFTEAEEFNLFETLYASLSSAGRLGTRTTEVLEQERSIDELITHQFLERYERRLQDLNDEQTRSLVTSSLKDDPVGQSTVLGILDRVLRSGPDGGEVSLSGKPVIVTYLLEVVEELKEHPTQGDDAPPHQGITEWAVYDLIVQNLMLRDWRQTPELLPEQRRSFLRRVSIWLSASGDRIVDNNNFQSLIRDEFKENLRKLPTDSREHRIEQLFMDLRRSSTLTRTKRSESSDEGWQFSHNSFREFFAAEAIVNRILAKEYQVPVIRVTDAMRLFVAARPDTQSIMDALAQMRLAGVAGAELGTCLTLLWDAGLRLFLHSEQPIREFLVRVFGESISLAGVVIRRLSFLHNGAGIRLPGTNWREAEIEAVDFCKADLREADFKGAILDGVSMREANLRGCDFHGALLNEIDLTGASVEKADFRGLIGCEGIRYGSEAFGGELALALLHRMGARTDKISPIALAKHHPDWSIAEKIAGKLFEEGPRQVHGLTQKGAARDNPDRARDFIKVLLASGLIEEVRRNELVRATPDGRAALRALHAGTSLHPALAEFFNIDTSE